MYLFYVDESGTHDPTIEGVRPDGSSFQKDWIYVTVAVSLFERRWYKFEKIINDRKISLMHRIYTEKHLRLNLGDTEIKSSWVRYEKARSKESEFLASLTKEEIDGVVEIYYDQLIQHKMHLFAVIIDKRYLETYMDHEKLHRKAYELLLERCQNFLSNWHPKHLGLIVADNTSKQMNRSLALKHSYFQREGTTSNLKLRNIVELPMFVESYLSNGVQLADLCSYNVYRAFKTNNPAYGKFPNLVPFFYTSPKTAAKKIDGLKVFPDNSPLVDIVKELENRRE